MNYGKLGLSLVILDEYLEVFNYFLDLFLFDVIMSNYSENFIWVVSSEFDILSFEVISNFILIFNIGA